MLKDFLLPDKKEANTIISKAARKLETSKWILFKEAFTWFHGREPDDEVLSIYYEEHRKGEITPPWAFQYARNILDPKVIPFSKVQRRKRRKNGTKTAKRGG